MLYNSTISELVIRAQPLLGASLGKPASNFQADDHLSRSQQKRMGRVCGQVHKQDDPQMGLVQEASEHPNHHNEGRFGGRGGVAVFRLLHER
ncbi:unnamed protein product [Symbiodinium necroappetens]|uniref:Uncharacterized protein n=1 Tax=Symbiodinium necroappetens TaxID=1628268 RepID=A0A812KEG0_9DINO|nr:unnamed protein product [Symbiodinium necroappetens]